MGSMTVLDAMGQRDIYRSFWNGFSDKADNSSMMLNKNADELEAFDREDILASLPDYSGMDVLDIGAGIGRFTSVFAQYARHVTATDFIEQFIEKNRQRNAYSRNITYKVVDAVGLKMASGSLGMIFSNWLMMYLNDEEVLQFLRNAIDWLKPGGFIHLRESCSEPSTGRVSTTLHDSTSTNPTRYRFSSIYIELLRSISYFDKQGVQWRFQVEWSCSVPTYIEYQNNWRQVHWLARKVVVSEIEYTSASVIGPIQNGVYEISSNDELLEKFGVKWPAKQRIWDSILDGQRNVWTDNIFKHALTNLVPKGSTILSFNQRKIAYHTHVNAHFVAEQFSCKVWNVETNPYFYRISLTKANQIKDRRVRFGWNSSLKGAVAFWNNASGESVKFNGFLGTEVMAEVLQSEDSSQVINDIKELMSDKSFLVTLEPISEADDELKIKEVLSNCFKSVDVVDVTASAKLELARFFVDNQQAAPSLPNNLRWVLVKAVC